MKNMAENSSRLFPLMGRTGNQAILYVWGAVLLVRCVI